MSLSYGLERLQPQHNPFRIVSEGSSEYPSNLNYQLEGDAVGLSERYPSYGLNTLRALSGIFFFSDHFTGRFNIVDGEGDDPLAFIF
jgi:hypothetical protein